MTTNTELRRRIIAVCCALIGLTGCGGNELTEQQLAYCAIPEVADAMIDFDTIDNEFLDQLIATDDDGMVALVQQQPWFEDECRKVIDEQSDSYVRVHASIPILADCDDIDASNQDIPTMTIVIRDADGDHLADMEPSPINGDPNEFIGNDNRCTNLFLAEGVPRMDSYVIDAGRLGEHTVHIDDFRGLASDMDPRVEPVIFELTVD